MRLHLRAILAAWLILAGTLRGAGTLPARLPCKVTPRVIEVGAFYDGTDVRVEGVAAPNAKVIVTVTGTDREEAFNRKARFGPAWLNAGKVRISGAPSLFLRFTSEALCPAEIQGFDEASLMARMHVEPRSADIRADRKIRADYLALKKADGVYVFADRGVVLGEPGEAGAPFRVAFRWPKKAPPADYQVRVYEIQDHDGEANLAAAVPITVARRGFPAWLAGLAEKRAAIYGITAVLVGVLAGFGIDFLTTTLFGKKRSMVH